MKSWPPMWVILNQIHAMQCNAMQCNNNISINLK